MQLLFAVENGKTTVGSSNLKDHYSQINESMAWDEFRVDLRQATRDRVVPWIGKAFYNDLAARWNDENEALTDKEMELVEILQDCIAHYTVWEVSPKKNVTISDMGVREQNSQQGLSNPASAWRYYHFHWKLMKKADELLDQVLLMLEDNLEDFPLFDAQRASLTFNNSLIRHTADYQQYVNINNSRRTFLKLQPSIRLADKRFIQPLLGAAQYADLLNKVQQGELSETDLKLLEACQEVVAHKALFLAIPHLTVLIENGSIMVVSSSDGMNTRQTAQKERIISLTARAEEDSNIAFEALRDFLYVNVEDYPLWKESGAYDTFDGRSGYPMDFGAGGVFLG